MDLRQAIGSEEQGLNKRWKFCKVKYKRALHGIAFGSSKGIEKFMLMIQSTYKLSLELERDRAVALRVIAKDFREDSISVREGILRNATSDQSRMYIDRYFT